MTRKKITDLHRTYGRHAPSGCWRQCRPLQPNAADVAACVDDFGWAAVEIEVQAARGACGTWESATCIST